VKIVQLLVHFGNTVMVKQVICIVCFLYFSGFLTVLLLQ